MIWIMNGKQVSDLLAMRTLFALADEQGITRDSVLAKIISAENGNSTARGILHTLSNGTIIIKS